MSSRVWKKSAIFCRRQRHQCRDPQAKIQPSGMCYKKEPQLLQLSTSFSTRTVIRFHGCIHGDGFLKSIKINRTRRQWQRSSTGVSMLILEAASEVLPSIETWARCPSVVPEAQPRALREGNARRFLCEVEPRTQLLIGLEFFQNKQNIK